MRRSIKHTKRKEREKAKGATGGEAQAGRKREVQRSTTDSKRTRPKKKGKNRRIEQRRRQT